VEEAQSALPGEYFQAGAALPCPHVETATGVVEPRCGATPGNERLVQLRYPAGSPALDPFFEESLAAVGSDELVCVFDPDLTDTAAAPDVNYCYWITRAEPAPSSGDPFLEFDVTQQSRADPADNAVVAPVALRKTRECVLSADVAAGTRTIECSPDFIARDGERAGQWIWLQEGTETCGDGDATACELHPRPWRISRTRDGGSGSDELELLDVRGVDRSFPHACDAGPATCRGFVTAAAWLEGDPLSIWVPVILRSGTTGRTRKIDEDDSSPRFAGALELRSVVFDGTGRFNQEGDLVVLGWEDVAMFDLAASAHAKVRVFQQATGQTATFGHTMVAGTSRCSEGDTSQSGCPEAGLGIFPGETCVVAEADGTGHATFLDFALRHCGGAGLAMNLDDASFSVERLRSQFRGTTPGSFLHCQGSCEVVDAECIDCANSRVISDGGDWDVDDLLLVGGSTGIALGYTEGEERLHDATVVGVTTTSNGGFLQAVEQLESFVLRDLVVGAGQRLIDTSSGGPRPFVVRDGWIMNTLGSTSPLLKLGSGTTAENLAVVDTDRSAGPCTVIGRGGGPGHLALRHVLLGWSFGRSSQCDVGLVATLGSGQTAEYADLLVTNFSGTALGGSQAEAIVWGGDLCAANDAIAFAPEVEQDFASMSPAALPEIVRGSFSVGEWPAVTCGLSAPAGVSQKRWTHVVNLVEPESVGPALAASLLPPACGDGRDNDGDGAVDLADPGCADEGSLDESPQCQDGANNDGDGLVDFDGGESIHGACVGGTCPPGVSDPNSDGVADPDPQCAGQPWKDREAARRCGLGFEIALPLLALLRMTSLTRRRAGARGPRGRP
jgi:hypothetical protein